MLSPAFWAPSQYPKRSLLVRSRKVSKPRDWYFKLSYRFEIWQAHRQHCCRSACQISKRSDNSKYKSRGFETWRDLTERRLFGYWDGALVVSSPYNELISTIYAAEEHWYIWFYIPLFCRRCNEMFSVSQQLQLQHQYNGHITYNVARSSMVIIWFMKFTP